MSAAEVVIGALKIKRCFVNCSPPNFHLNFSPKADGSVETTFHMKPLWVGGMEFCLMDYSGDPLCPDIIKPLIHDSKWLPAHICSEDMYISTQVSISGHEALLCLS